MTDDLAITMASLETTAGLSMATVAISNTFQTLFNKNPRWLALLVAMALSLSIPYLNQVGGRDYFVAFLNSFIVYLTAIGAAQIPGAMHAKTNNAISMAGGPSASRVARARRFLDPWF